MPLFSSDCSQTNWNTLINCAGESQSKLLHQASTETISRLIQVNLEASIALSKCFFRQWLQSLRSAKAKPGKKDIPAHPSTSTSACIINVSSLLAVKGGMGASVYAATKAGLLAFTRALALEASELRNRIMEDGPALRVNAIVPGFIDTAMIDGKLFLINLC